MLQNELSRTKRKLKMFYEQGDSVLNWVLLDLLTLLGEQEHLDSGITEEWKLGKIEELKEKYKSFILENTPKKSKQQNLFK